VGRVARWKGKKRKAAARIVLRIRRFEFCGGGAAANTSDIRVGARGGEACSVKTDHEDKGSAC